MKIIFMGTPEFSVRILESLANRYEVVMVVTQPDKYIGRKKILTYPPVKQKAIELGIEVFQPINIKEDYEAILNKKADMIVSAAYGQIIPDILIDSHKKCINVHASLLPKYRGAAPIQRAIMNGDSVTGVSIIDMVHKMDAGNIYAKREIPILESDTNKTLFEKLSIVGNDLLLDVIDDIINLKLEGIPQDEDLVTFANQIKREEEKIDFNDTSLNIFNKIRGLSLEPGAYGIINNTSIKVYSSIIKDYNGSEKPGTVLSLKKEILVKTLDGAISLVDIKPEGKQMMKSQSFVNGQKIINVFDLFI